MLQQAQDRKSVYWKAIPLLPGLYRLDIAIKDVNNPDHVGLYGSSLEVPGVPRRAAGYQLADSGRRDERGFLARDWRRKHA